MSARYLLGRVSCIRGKRDGKTNGMVRGIEGSGEDWYACQGGEAIARRTRRPMQLEGDCAWSTIVAVVSR